MERGVWRCLGVAEVLSVWVRGGWKTGEVKEEGVKSGYKTNSQVGSLCRDLGNLVKRNENSLCDHVTTKPAWVLWCPAGNFPSNHTRAARQMNQARNRQRVKHCSCALLPIYIKHRHVLRALSYFEWFSVTVSAIYCLNPKLSYVLCKIGYFCTLMKTRTATYSWFDLINLLFFVFPSDIWCKINKLLKYYEYQLTKRCLEGRPPITCDRTLMKQSLTLTT